MTIKKLQNGSDIRGIAIDGVEGEAVNLGNEETAALSKGYMMWLSNKIEKPADELTQKHQSCLDEEKESHDACYESPIEHFIELRIDNGQRTAQPVT